MKKQNRLIYALSAAGRKKQKVFCAFLTLGYPNVAATAELIKKFEKEGVDIIELGFPFSDPLADGPTIQYSSEQALKKGVVMEDAFRTVAKLRKEGVKLPILFFGYFNPVFRYGPSKFAKKACAAGFDGAIIPDLPPDEEAIFSAQCRKQDFAQVYLVAPTTARKRAGMITRRSGGFVYYVSLRGVTGARKGLAADMRQNLSGLKRLTAKPVLVGFGVSTPDHAKKAAKMSSGVIVGSAIVDAIRKSGGKTGPVAAFVGKMVRAAKS